MNGRVYLIPQIGPIELGRFVDQQGWRARDQPDDGYEETWEVPGRDATVHWLDDGLLGFEEFVVEGPDRAAVAATIRAAMPVHGPEEMPGVFARATSDHQLTAALYELAAVMPSTVDPALLPLVHRGLTHGDPIVRRSALVAVTAAAWPELAADVRRLASDDPDPKVRSDATETLATLGQDREAR